MKFEYHEVITVSNSMRDKLELLMHHSRTNFEQKKEFKYSVKWVLVPKLMFN